MLNIELVVAVAPNFLEDWASQTLSRIAPESTSDGNLSICPFDGRSSAQGLVRWQLNLSC